MIPRNRIIPVFVSHLGCPHQCVFCNQVRIAGKAVNISADEVSSIISRSLSFSGSGAEVAFYGGSFTALPVQAMTELLSAVKPFLDHGSVSSIRVSTRPDCLDEEVLSLLSSFGVSTVELGCQSTDDSVLRAAGRGHSSDDIRHAVQLLRRNDFHYVLQMMTGLPGSSIESELQSVRDLISLQPDAVRIYPTIVVKDSPLFLLWKAGSYTPQTLENAVALCAEAGRMFSEAGIPVLRYGLQPTEELSSGGAVAGPYHPAFGELVKSRMVRNALERQLRFIADNIIDIAVPERLVSIVVGQNKCNLLWLRTQFPSHSICIHPAKNTASVLMNGVPVPVPEALLPRIQQP